MYYPYSNSYSLLIHAAPGARSGLVASWLLKKLDIAYFDVGANIQPKFNKIHQITDKNQLREFNGFKIKIQSNLEYIDQHLLLYLRKNIWIFAPRFTKDEYSIEMYSELMTFALDVLNQQLNLNEDLTDIDYSLYNETIDFIDTYNTASMINLYQKFNNCHPTDNEIVNLEATNKCNTVEINKNQVYSIIKLILTKEKKLGLKEENRVWSIVDVYKSTPIIKLYETVDGLINTSNYRQDLNKTESIT